MDKVEKKPKRKLPLPGQRIIRTVIAVWLCFAVYLLRGRQGLPIFSTIAVLSGIQPYVKSMPQVAKEKVLGTIIGAAWGLFLITLELLLIEGGLPDERIHYLLVGLFTGVTIYSTVLLKVSGMASFAAVVFLCIAINHIQGVNAYGYAFNRLLDTVIGLLIAEVVNRVQLPRARHRDILFVSGLGHTILRQGSSLTPYSKVELNRLIEDGALFTISTRASQATVREQLQGVDLRLPIITLDGAALYDLHKSQYLRTVPMAPDSAKRIMDWARERELPFFYHIIQNDILIIRYWDLANAAMQDAFDARRGSLYRNYVRTPQDVYEDVVYLTIIDRTERIARAYEDLKAQSWAGQYRVVMEEYYFGTGFSFLRVYDSAVSREAMLEQLKALLGVTKTMTFGCTQGDFDVYIQDADRNTVVKQVRRRFEPVDFRCWNTILRR